MAEYLDKEVFQKLDFELVIYDEIEKFKDYDNPEFNYPYQKRKSNLNSFTISNVDFALNDGVFSLLDYQYS